MQITPFSRWREALSSKGDSGKHFMEKLIAKYPRVAEIVLDRSVTFSEHHLEDPNLQVTFDFRFLEESPQSRSLFSDVIEIMKAKRKDLYFAPKVMVRNRREELIFHPIVSTLIKMKNTRLARYFYYLKFGIFMVFNILLNLIIVEEAKE